MLRAYACNRELQKKIDATQAVEVANTIDNPLSQSSRLDYPASLYAKFGEKELAEKTFKNAISEAQKIEEPRRRADRMFYLAKKLRRQE